MKWFPKKKMLEILNRDYDWLTRYNNYDWWLMIVNYGKFSWLNDWWLSFINFFELVDVGLSLEECYEENIRKLCVLKRNVIFYIHPVQVEGGKV